jgi:hypothetical protein
MIFKHSVTEARKLWCEMLRSGEFQQGQKLLCAGDGRHCCLGVACRAFSRHEWPLAENLSSGNDGDYFTFNGNWATTPDDVCRWLGLDDGICTEGSMMYANDHDHKSFTQIAELIESCEVAK